MADAAYGALLDALRGVRWPARRRVRGALPGAHRSRMRGNAPELSEYRPYRQGEDTRRIDWKLYARSDRAYIRLADDHAILPTLLLVDASASMAFPEPGFGKWRLARQVAVGLASVANAGGDPVGVLVASNERAELPPRSRRGVIGEISRLLDGVAPAGATPLEPLLRRAPAGARCVVVSDLLGDEPALRKAAGVLAAAGGEVHVVHVVAREERDPPESAMLAVDPEAPDVRRPLTGETRREYLRRFGEWLAERAVEWRASGLTYTLAETGEGALGAVRRVALLAPAEPRS